MLIGRLNIIENNSDCEFMSASIQTRRVPTAGSTREKHIQFAIETDTYFWIEDRKMWTIGPNRPPGICNKKRTSPAHPTFDAVELGG